MVPIWSMVPGAIRPGQVACAPIYRRSVDEIEQLVGLFVVVQPNAFELVFCHGHFTFRSVLLVPFPVAKIER